MEELKEELRESVMEELKEELRELKEELKEELREEVKKELKKEFRKTSQTDQGKQPKFRLKIMSTVEKVVYKGSNIKTNTGDCIEVVMLDDGKPIAPHHHLASAKVELVLLNELFKKADEECWTIDEFNTHIIGRRERKSVIRNHTFDLTGGSCCCNGVRIMENSNRKLVRLGVKVVGRRKERVLEGVLSEPFQVKEPKTKDYAKHAIPSLDDDIYRLDGIRKNSDACIAIQDAGIKTVGDLLSLYCEDYAELEKILKHAYHRDTNVEAIIKHAKRGNGLRFYEEGDVMLFFNYEDQLVGAQFSGIYHKYTELQGREKDHAIALSKTAKDNKKSWRGGYEMKDDRPKQWQPRSLGPNSAQPTSVQMLNNVQGSTGGGQQQTFGNGRGNSLGLPSENFAATLSLSCQTPVQMVEQGGAGCYQQEGFRDRHEPQTSEQMVMQNTSSQMVMQNVQGSTGGGQQQTFGNGRGNSLGLPSENFATMLSLSCQTPVQMEQGGAGCYQQEGFRDRHEPPMVMHNISSQMVMPNTSSQMVTPNAQGGASFAQHHNQSGSVQLQSFHTVRQQEMKETQPLLQSYAPVYSDPAQHGVRSAVGGQNQDSESSVGESSTFLSLSSLCGAHLDV